jgi:iron complex transport system ATP-binding protein
LAAVGATHLAGRDFTQLSGGEQQLVWLAQLSLHDAALYLLDEPTQQLDVYYRRRVFELIHNWTQRDGKTVLCSTHDVDSLPELSGFLFNLAEETPTLRPISVASVREARAVLEAAPRPPA